MIDPVSPKTTSELLRSQGLRPKKRLGQNFLCDRNTLDRIVRAANLTSEDPTLEIGGGMGALTLALAAISPSVTCIEIDKYLEPILREVTAPFPNVHLVFEDFMRLDLPTLLDTGFGDKQGTVVANIPYYITTPILERLIEHKSRFKRIVMLVQNEVAHRLAAPPGSDDCGSISLFTQYHCEVELVGTVPKTVFVPQPDVSSAIIAFTPILPGAVSVQDETRMFHIIRAAFAQRRKTLLNSLLRAPASFGLGFSLDNRSQVESLLERVGIDGSRRGETLSLPEFARISDASLVE